MPGPVLHVGAVITCPHLGTVTPQSSNVRVQVNGMPALTIADVFPVAGCPFQVPVGAGTKPQPCVRIQWSTPAARVQVNGVPVLLALSTGIGLSAEQIPGGPAVVSAVQPRVVAT
jgi:hypothetical protein